MAISHRWLDDEINLTDLGLFYLRNNINIGQKLCKDLYKKNKINIKNGKNINWNHYLNFFKLNENNKSVHNHYKLIKIINQIKNNNKKYNYIWLDTLCIDKSSSAELSENIVSMFQIYKNSGYVHVYLNNIYVINDIINILKDEWWTRAWTLQEYLANKNIEFYDNENRYICKKDDICTYKKDITKLPGYLFINSDRPLYEIDIGCVFSCIDKRKSTIEEDIIYSLMGILNTYISPLYGEGIINALKRFIREYILNYNDVSIFNIIKIENICNKSFNEFNKYFHQEFYEDLNKLSLNRYTKEISIVNNKFKINTIINKFKLYINKPNNYELLENWYKNKNINKKLMENIYKNSYTVKQKNILIKIKK